MEVARVDNEKEEIEQLDINDEYWSCIVLLIKETNSLHESDVETFKIFAIKQGDSSEIEVITNATIGKYIIELQKRSENKVDKNQGKEGKTVEDEEGNNKKGEKRKSKGGKEGTSKGSKKGTSKGGKGETTTLGALKRQALAIKKHILGEKLRRTLPSKGTGDTDGNATPIDGSAKFSGRKTKKGKKKEKLADQEQEAAKSAEPEPVCGPNKYFVLAGFNDPALILELMNVRVPLVGIIAYGNKEDSITTDKIEDITQPKSVGEQSQKLSSKKKNKKSKEALSQKVTQYWNDVDHLIENPMFQSELCNFVIFHCEPISLDTSDKSSPKGKIIYDYLKRAMFEISTQLRHYIHYINSGAEVNVPLVEETLELWMFPEYQQMLNGVPLENITVEFILHCMMEQVSSGESESDEGLSNETRSSVHVSESWHSCQPVIIYHTNKIKRLTFNIKPDLSEIALDLYRLMPFSKLFEQPSDNHFKIAMEQFQFMLLQKCLKDEKVSDEDFEILVHHLLFREMYHTILLSHVSDALKIEELVEVPLISPSTTNVEEASIKPSQSTSSSEENYSFFRDKMKKKLSPNLHKLQSFFNCEEINHLKSILTTDDDFLKYSVIEELGESELLQSLYRARKSYSSMYFVPFQGTESVLLFFHNDYNEFGLAMENQSEMCKTSVGFRDYYKYVRHKIKEWLVNQESSIAAIDKRRELEIAFKRKTKGMERIAAFPHPTKSLMKDVLNAAHIFYNVDGTYLFTSEKETKFYSNEGVTLTVKCIKWEQAYTYLSFILDSFATNLTYHYFLKDQNSMFSQQDLYFNVETEKGILISVVQKLIDEPRSNEENENTIKSKSRGKTKTLIQTPPEKIDFYDINITLPTGLMIEIRHDRDYIKQQYVEGSSVDDLIKEEKYRLYLKNGTLVTFKKNNKIDVFYLNGSKVSISKIMKEKIKANDKTVNAESAKTKAESGPGKQSKNNKKSGEKSKTKSKNKSAKKEKKSAEGSPNSPEKGSKKNKGSKKSRIKKNKEETTDKSAERIKEKEYNYKVGEAEIFGHGGEYLRIWGDSNLSAVQYVSKLRVANRPNELVISRSDGLFTYYYDTAVNVVYPEGTLIGSAIFTFDYVNVAGIISRAANEDLINYRLNREFDRLWKEHFFPFLLNFCSQSGIFDLQKMGNAFHRLCPKVKYAVEDVLIHDAKVKSRPSFLEEAREIHKKKKVMSEEESEVDGKKEGKRSVVEKKFEEPNLGDDIPDAEASFEVVDLEYKMQHRLFAEVGYNERKGEWKISLPGNVKIMVGERCSAVVMDGTKVFIGDKQVTVLSEDLKTKEVTSTKVQLTRTFDTPEDLLCSCEDSLGRNFTTNSLGKMEYFMTEDEGNVDYHPNQRKLFNRFYVIRTDLSGYELIHEEDNKATLGEYTRVNLLQGDSLLSVAELDIYKTRTQTFEMPVENLVVVSRVCRNHLSDYISKKKWLSDVNFEVRKGKKRQLPEKIPPPVAVVVRSVKINFINYKHILKNLNIAFDKIESVKKYLYKLYEENENEVNLEELYNKISNFIGRLSHQTSETSIRRRRCHALKKKGK